MKPAYLLLSQNHTSYFTLLEEGGLFKGYKHVDEPSPVSSKLGIRFHEEGREWMPFHISTYGVIVISERAKAQLSDHGIDSEILKPIDVVSIASRRLKATQPPQYWWFYPTRIIDADLIRYTTSQGVNRGYYWRLNKAGKQIIGRPIEGYGVLVSVDFVCLARKYRWQGLGFRPIDCPSDFSGGGVIDYLGKQWPPQWWPDGYEPHPSNVIEGEVPDIKVGESLSSEEARPEALKPTARRKTKDSSGRLIAEADIRKLKLEENNDTGELEAEVPLNRSLYGAEELEVSVVIEDEEAAPKRSVIKAKVQEALTALDCLMPDIETRISNELKTSEEDTADGAVKNLHSPSLLFVIRDDVPGPVHWSFVVEGEPVAVHVELEGEKIVDVWSGD